MKFYGWQIDLDRLTATQARLAVEDIERFRESSGGKILARAIEIALENEMNTVRGMRTVDPERNLQGVEANARLDVLELIAGESMGLKALRTRMVEGKEKDEG